MRAIRGIMAITLGAVLLFAFPSCDREITRVEQVTPDASACFTCHSDQDGALIAAELQWQNSLHASGLNTDRNNASCSACHTHEGFLDQAAGVSPGSYPNAAVIHCFTCHAPHTRSDFSLRLDSPATLANGVATNLGGGNNLCAQCHQARRNVNTYVSGQVRLNDRWGPHYSVQADMLLGTNGYEYADYDYGDMVFHRTTAEGRCLGCHYDHTQNFVVGGHSFNMRATLAGLEILNLGGCNECHEPELSDFAYHDVPATVENLQATLGGLLETAGLLHDGHPTSVTTSADSAGAVWNYLLVHEDRSHGVHNSQYAISLLESSIAFLQGGP